MRRGSWAADLSVLRAASIRGVIRARTLVELGVPEKTVYARCREGGPWQRLLPGIVLLTNGPATREQLLTAALMHAGPTGMITGLEACRRHGVRRGPAPGPGVHVLVDHTCHMSSSGFVVVERTHRLPVPETVDGFPLAPAFRACTDGARRLRLAGDIAELFADAVQRGLCTVAELCVELDSGTRKGTGTPRKVLAEVRDGIRSAAELRAKQIWSRTGLPEAWWNVPIVDDTGRSLGTADCWVDDVALIWEIESSEWHMSPADHDRSVAKAARFAARGALYVPTKPRMLRLDEAEVIQTLRDAYGHARNRPRPPLRALR
jgi:hypothetical protein